MVVVREARGARNVIQTGNEIEVPYMFPDDDAVSGDAESGRLYQALALSPVPTDKQDFSLVRCSVLVAMLEAKERPAPTRKPRSRHPLRGSAASRTPSDGQRIAA